MTLQEMTKSMKFKGQK